MSFLPRGPADSSQRRRDSPALRIRHDSKTLFGKFGPIAEALRQPVQVLRQPVKIPRTNVEVLELGGQVQTMLLRAQPFALLPGQRQGCAGRVTEGLGDAEHLVPGTKTIEKSPELKLTPREVVPGIEEPAVVMAQLAPDHPSRGGGIDTEPKARVEPLCGGGNELPSRLWGGEEILVADDRDRSTMQVLEQPQRLDLPAGVSEGGRRSVARGKRERDLDRVANREHRMQQMIDQWAPEIEQSGDARILDHERPLAYVFAQPAEQILQTIRCLGADRQLGLT